MNTFQTLLRKYMQGSMSDEELEELRHMTESLNDSELQQQLFSAWDDSDEEVKMDERQKQMMMEAIARNIQHRGGSGRMIKHLLRIAAIFICIIAGASLWFNRTTEKPSLPPDVVAAIEKAEKAGKNQATVTANGQTVNVSSDEAIAEWKPNSGGNQAATTDGERIVTTHHDSEFWLTLEDGTRVHLNYGTQLTYPIHFSGDTREVELTGEAYFFVAKDKSRPFIVHTPNGDVKQYGTEFNINTKDEIGATRVVLVNGSISITPNGGTESMMRPNDMAIIMPQSSEVMISQVDITPYIAWNTGTFVFDDCTLEQLMRVLSHWYNKHIEFYEEDIRQMRFTGEIDKYESIIPTMEAIHKVTGLRIEVRKQGILIRRSFNP